MTPARWWAQPALHFALLGAAVFAVDRWRHPPSDPRAVVISADFVRGLRDELTRRGGRAPTDGELRGAIDAFVDEEVLYREALSLGLERGDVVVRRRLVQKMEFLAEDDLGPDPDDDALRRRIAARPDRYGLPLRVRFTAVFVNAAGRGASADADASAIAERLARGDNPSTLGDPSDLAGARYAEVDRVASELGPEVARALRELPPGRWSAPLRSRYGVHLVRVESRDERRLPALEEVRPRVLQEWRDERVAEARRAAVRRLRESYSVRVEAAP